MKTIRILVASTSILKSDFTEFYTYLINENNHLLEDEYSLELNKWEYPLDSTFDDGQKDKLEKKLQSSDIFICLFHFETDKNPFQKFEDILKRFISYNNSLIVTYLKVGKDENISDHISNIFFSNSEEQSKQLVHVPYRNIDILKNHFNKQLDIKGKIGLTFSQKEKQLKSKKSFFNKNTNSGSIQAGGNVHFGDIIYSGTSQTNAPRKVVYNKHLTKRIIEGMLPYEQKAVKLNEEKSWENKLGGFKKVQNFISKSFVGEIGKLLRQLHSIGEEDDKEDVKQSFYVSKCLDISRRCLDLVNFSMLSKLWDELKTNSHQLSYNQKNIIAHRYDNNFEQSFEEQFQLLKTLYEIFKDCNIPLPIKEVRSIEKYLFEGSQLNEICKSLQEISQSKECQLNEEGCLIAEKVLGDFLQFFSFLINYKMVSISEIAYQQVRNTKPRYLHRYTAIGIDNKANIDAEKVNYAEDGEETPTVLLFHGESYNDHVSLFPFVIDINALTLEKGAKIYFYSSNDLTDGILEYRFLGDNSIFKIEKNGISNDATDLNELLLKKENRIIYNLDNVVDGFRNSRKTIVGDTLDLNDL